MTGIVPTATSVTDAGGVKEKEGSKPGWKCYLVQDQVFEIPTRYQLLDCIGRGAFGIVCSAKTKDSEGQEIKVAIKKVVIREDNILEVKRLVRELCLLRHFNHENIIGLRDIIEPMTEGNFHNIYVVAELMDTDLHQIIRSRQKLTEEHVQFFVYQLLRGLKCIHSSNVLHRDLKPSNVVVNANCDLKICDFGLAREQDFQNEMTDYVATRWYRAPELLMQWRGYAGGVDVWSAGCIFAELLVGKPLFPGRNYLDQLHIIMEVVGSPKDEDIEGIGSEKARNYIRHLKPKRQRRDFRKMFPSVTDEAVDLLDKMLQFNPNQRITVNEALEHPYFAAMHDADDEPDGEPFEFDSVDIRDATLTVFDLKSILFEQLIAFHPSYKDWIWYTPGEKNEAAIQKKEKIKRAMVKKNTHA